MNEHSPCVGMNDFWDIKNVAHYMGIE